MPDVTLHAPWSEIPLLGETPRPPRALHARGNWKSLGAPLVAIVGTRDASSYGMRAAWAIARELATHGIGVVSGLARGIDSAAHRGALDGGGFTAAVLGHGLNHLYPAENRWLADAIVQRGGCLVTEYESAVRPAAYHFPQRNRLIAGLTLGTLVVEAAEKSGSLITAREALDANREVFVIPGRFDDSAFRGGHRLLAEGATLVTSAADILVELGLAPARPRARAPRERDVVREILVAMGGEATLEGILSRAPGTFAETLALVEKARDAGQLAEISPQRFAWVAPDAIVPATSGSQSKTIPS